MRLSFWLWAAFLSFLSSGCAFFEGVTVDTIATSAQRPSNIAMYVEVTDSGEPVKDLEAKNFSVYENGQPLASNEIQRSLLPREQVTSEHVVLLVDISGKPSHEQRVTFVKAIDGFVGKVRDKLSTSVFAYDGSAKIRLIAEFPQGTTEGTAEPLINLPTSDASRNLHGAVVKGLEHLELRLKADRKPVRLGTLVVFARGPDVAGRVSEDQMYTALEGTKRHVIGVGVGADLPYLNGVENAGLIHSQNANTLPIAFEEAASRVLSTRSRYYLVAYCSPARDGERSVRLEVKYTNKSGDEFTGEASFEFDARGFKAGCSVETPPRFVAQKDQPPEPTPPPPPPAEETKPAPRPRSGGAPRPAAPEDKPAEDEVVKPPDSSDYAP
jgi:hypothetical protein